MQLLNILSHFNTGELSAIQQRVKDYGNANLLTLFKELKKYRSGKWEFDKEKVFQKVFNEAYTTATNYKWKNLISVLKQVVYQYLADAEMARESRENVFYLNKWVLKALARRRIDDVFLSEAEKQIDNVKEEYLPEWLSEYYRILSNYHLTYSFESKLSEKEHMQLMDERLEQEIKRMVYQIKDIEAEKAFLLRAEAIRTRYLETFDQALEMDTLQAINLKDYEDLKVKQLELTKMTYLLRGLSRTRCMQESLAILRKLDQPTAERYESELTLIFNIGSALLSIHQFEEADKYMDESVAFAVEHKLLIPESVHYMKMSIMLQRGLYVEAVNYYKGHFEAIKASSYRVITSAVLCYCYLFLGKTKEAVKVNHIEDMIRSRKYDSRFITLASFVVDGDYEGALREVGNLKKTVDYELAENENVSQNVKRRKLVVGFFEQYILCKLETKDKSKDRLNKLWQELAAIDLNLEITNMNFLWIKRTVKNEIGA